MKQGPMTAKEVAGAMGVALATFYKRHETYRLRDGMPAPITKGKLNYERSGMMAWLTRHHPARASQVAANDVLLPPDPTVDAEHQARLHAAYAPARALQAIGQR